MEWLLSLPTVQHPLGPAPGLNLVVRRPQGTSNPFWASIFVAWAVQVYNSLLLPIMLIVGTLPYIQLLVLVERFRFSRGAKCTTVTSSEYAKDWPLTVDAARLCCRFRAVWVEVNGKKYGVNGTARPLLKKYGFECPDLNEIWKDHPDKEKWLEASGTDGEDIGWKVSIHRLIQDGLALEAR